MSAANAVAVKILAAIGLLLTILAGIAWLVFVGGFGNQIVSMVGTRSISFFTGPTWDPYWVVTVLSPILIIMLFAKTILLIVSDGLFRKYCAIQVLAVMTFILTVIVLCFLGDILNTERINIDRSIAAGAAAGFGNVNASFAGALLEVFFLSGTWICCILSYLFGETKSSTE